MMRTVFRIAVLLAALALSFSTRAQTKRPWAEPAFTASPVALAQEAAAATAGETDDALILREEGRYDFDAEGRSVYTWRMVYRILSERGAEGWGTTQVRWQPWHQERPTLRARVVTGDGAEHWLEEKTIGEFPVAPGAPDTYHDAREVTLHAMEVQNLEEPSEIYWFIFGRIAEHFGESDSALAVYRRAIPAKAEEDPFLSTTELAQKRIAALEVTAKEKQPPAKPPKK